MMNLTSAEEKELHAELLQLVKEHFEPDKSIKLSRGFEFE